MPGLTGFRLWPSSWFCLLLAACASLPSDRLAELPLPEPGQLPCCWQYQEQVTLTLPETEFQWRAAVAVRKDTLTLVVLDSLGRRVARVRQAGGDVATESALPQWRDQWSHLILLGHYLHYLDLEAPPVGWPPAEAGWSLSIAADEKKLLFRDREVLRLQYPDEKNRPDRRRLHIAGRDIILTIETVQGIRLNAASFP